MPRQQLAGVNACWGTSLETRVGWEEHITQARHMKGASLHPSAA
jgi:hypothetical protein